MFWDYHVNTMAANGLAPSVAMASATIGITKPNKPDLAFHEKDSKYMHNLRNEKC